MAATDQKIAQIQREMEQAQHELRRVQAAMEKQRAEITAANRRELEELARQTGERLRERDKQVQKQYEAMLEKSVSAQETRLEQEFRSYQAKYEQLAVQLRGALAQEQQKTEEALLAQKQFEQAYFARRDFSRQRAEEVCTRTFTQVREALRTEPLEWCSTGCSERFRTALANMEQWMKEGFYESVIAIGENVNKRSLLSLEARKKLIEELYAGDERVECITYSTLTGDAARKVGATAIIRGLRNTIDFEYERTMAQANRRIFPELQSVMLFTPAEVCDISSSTIRELLAFGRDVSELMPEGVKLENYLTKE